MLEAGVPPHARTPVFDVPTVPGMETTVIAAVAPFDDVLAAVAAAQPTRLVGYPTVIGRLARASGAGDLSIRPVRVSTNSEPLLDEDRQAISDAWNAPIHNLWGSTEIGVQAAFRHILGTDPRVSEYQVVQTATGADIVVVGVPNAAALTSALSAALRRYGVSEPRIRIRVATSLQRHHSSGKLRRFIPL